MKILDLKEASLSRLLKHTQEHDCATLTAYRSEYSHRENQQRNKNLEAKIKVAGYKYISVEGVYIENRGEEKEKKSREHVFFVIDWKDWKELYSRVCEWGEEFEQESVLFIPKGGKEALLIGTKNVPSNFPPYKKTEKFSTRQWGKDDNDFLTYINGRPMYFTERVIGEDQLCGTNMGRWGASLYAKKHWSEMEVED